MSDLPPLPNDPAARTPEGALLDSRDTPPTSQTSSTTPEPTSEPSAATPEPKPEPAAAPDTYTFKPPEGGELDQKLVDAATPVFRELGLTQTQVDRLMDLQYSLSKNSIAADMKVIELQGQAWDAQTKADPELGPKLDTIKIDVARALDLALTPKERAEFAQAMNDTMIGNNPGFIRTIWKLAQKAAPGSHVSGGGPSPNGQSPSGQTKRPTIASAMFPNLAS